MKKEESLPVVSFRYGLSDIDEHEMWMKGWRDDIIVSLPNSNKYQLTFYDPGRLKQEVEQMGYLIERGLIVIKELTRKNIEEAVQKMWKSDFFDTLVPSEKDN